MTFDGGWGRGVVLVLPDSGREMTEVGLRDSDGYVVCLGASDDGRRGEPSTRARCLQLLMA